MVSEQYLKETWRLRVKAVETVVETIIFEMKPGM
jgi:hypothetical protein